ncbi:M48 family metallopeptidase [Pararhizobium sp. YC-54]|uniref:M48 family metallopeptidase n=1 Tax=Pararhizobium sp. YC-54 TaxID=2986920 RepID=UPI0021F7F504|nr:M48 family metallopeptidase [Pararhizobium sp. YC-54]MCV9998675.1 M48 family metallopeptidase [Pararhizobium sp. YC-54]
MASDDKPVCRGDWHPRQSSRSVPSRLDVRDGQVRAVADDGAELASAVFSTLDISARVGSIPRRIAFPDGSLFETTDNGAIDDLQLANGRKRAGLIHGLERFHPRLLVFVVAVFLLSGLVYRFALPVLVEVAVAVTPPVVPRLMSVSTLETLDRTVLGETKLDEGKRLAISDGFGRIAAHSARGPSAYTLNFREGGAIGPNAFALPDGTLIITDELVTLADGDTEMLVGVLAHEIGHVELEHSLRQIYRAAGMAGLIMLIAGDVGDSVEDLLVQGGGLLALSYSRDAEAAADRHSVELMQKAGYDPAAIARFFEIIEKKLGDTSGTTILSTHPGTPDRRKAIGEYEAEMRKKQAVN